MQKNDLYLRVILSLLDQLRQLFLWLNTYGILSLWIVKLDLEEARVRLTLTVND